MAIRSTRDRGDMRQERLWKHVKMFNFTADINMFAGWYKNLLGFYSQFYISHLLEFDLDLKLCINMAVAALSDGFLRPSATLHLR